MTSHTSRIDKSDVYLSPAHQNMFGHKKNGLNEVKTDYTHLHGLKVFTTFNPCIKYGYVLLLSWNSHYQGVSNNYIVKEPLSIVRIIPHLTFTFKLFLQ